MILRLIIAHLISDFFLQPGKWAKDKDTRGFKATNLYWHIIITFLVAIIFTWDINWIIPVVYISIIHLIIDGIKGEINKRKHQGIFPCPHYLFTIDQILHLLTILIVGGIYLDIKYFDFTIWSYALGSDKIWFIIFGYALVTTPLSFVIGRLTQNWNIEIKESSKTELSQNDGNGGLANAGKWIGILERTLILTFVFIQQYTAIGFIFAAKSVFRFGDLTNNKCHKKTEYIIVGSFLSFTISILIGLIINYLIEITSISQTIHSAQIIGK